MRKPKSFDELTCTSQLLARVNTICTIHKLDKYTDVKESLFATQFACENMKPTTISYSNIIVTLLEINQFNLTPTFEVVESSFWLKFLIALY